MPMQQFFTSTQFWTAPPGIVSVNVVAVGGGGAGAGNSTASGGGGGAYSAGSVSVTPGNNYLVTVGTGGQGLAGSGNNGTASSFTGDSSTVSADFGKHGVSSGVTGGAGGAVASCLGTTKFSGGNGGTGDQVDVTVGGGGSAAGNLSNGNVGGNGSASGNGLGGAAPSGGPGGAGGAGSSGTGFNGQLYGGGGGAGSVTGGSGYQGVVILSWGPQDPGLEPPPYTEGPPALTPWFKGYTTPDSYWVVPPSKSGNKIVWFFTDQIAVGSTDMGRLNDQSFPPPDADAAITAWQTGSVPGPGLQAYWKLKFNQLNVPANQSSVPYPDGNLVTSPGDSWRTPKLLTGNFRDDLWTIIFGVRSNIVEPPQGNFPYPLIFEAGFRIFRSSDPNGASRSEVTTNYNVVQGIGNPNNFPGYHGGVFAILNPGAADTLVHQIQATFLPGAFSLNGEYLFFECGIFVSNTSLKPGAPNPAQTWIPHYGPSYGIITPHFTDTSGPPPPVLPLDQPFILGPDKRSPYWKNVGVPDIPNIIPPIVPTPVYPPGFLGGPIALGAPFSLGPFPAPPGQGTTPPTTTFIPPPGFKGGPIPGTPYYLPTNSGRDDPRPPSPSPNPFFPAVAGLSLISRDPVDDNRLRRFMDQVSGLLNSLIRQGVLVRSSVADWRINLAPTVIYGLGPPNGKFDFTMGYQPGNFYIDSSTNTPYVNINNNPQGQALWMNLTNGTKVPF